eukprot:7686090-Alexandrium_andersonii.AAC.1
MCAWWPSSLMLVLIPALAVDHELVLEIAVLVHAPARVLARSKAPHLTPNLPKVSLRPSPRSSNGCS